MGVSRSALSHAIIGLEGKLGVRLFHRTTRSVSLTQAGARLLARLDPVLQDLDEALEWAAKTPWNHDGCFTEIRPVMNYAAWMEATQERAAS